MNFVLFTRTRPEENEVKRNILLINDSFIISTCNNIVTAKQMCRTHKAYLAASSIANISTTATELYQNIKYVYRRLYVIKQSIEETLLLGLCDIMIMRELLEYSLKSKRGIEQAKANNKRFGNPNTTNGSDKAKAYMKTLARINKIKSLNSPANIVAWKTIKSMKNATLRDKADKLNEMGIKTTYGRLWTPTKILRLIKRNTEQ